MKKIFTIALAFVAIALLPQTSFAQTDTKPVVDKEQKVIKTSKGDVVPVKKVAKETRKQTKPAVTPKSKSGAKTTPAGTQKTAKRATDKPREAIIKPIKNPKEKKVVVGKKMERKNKEVKKGKNKKVHKIQQNN